MAITITPQLLKTFLHNVVYHYSSVKVEVEVWEVEVSTENETYKPMCIGTRNWGTHDFKISKTATQFTLIMTRYFTASILGEFLNVCTHLPS